MLGGRCHQCSAPIPRSYFIVELFTPLSALMLAEYFGPEYGLVLLGGVLLLSWLLILMALIDFNALVVPRPLNLALIFGGVLWHTLHARELPIDFVSGAILGYLMLSAISWCASKCFGQQAMGGGDVLMFAGTGAWVGLNNIVDALWLSAAVGLALWFALGRPHHIPFAPAIGLTTFCFFLVNFG
ncbi:Leader peptidase PppA [compost metagenome]